MLLVDMYSKTTSKRKINNHKTKKHKNNNNIKKTTSNVKNTTTNVKNTTKNMSNNIKKQLDNTNISKNIKNTTSNIRKTGIDLQHNLHNVSNNIKDTITNQTNDITDKLNIKNLNIPDIKNNLNSMWNKIPYKYQSTHKPRKHLSETEKIDKLISKFKASEIPLSSISILEICVFFLWYTEQVIPLLSIPYDIINTILAAIDLSADTFSQVPSYLINIIGLIPTMIPGVGVIAAPLIEVIGIFADIIPTIIITFIKIIQICFTFSRRQWELFFQNIIDIIPEGEDIRILITTVCLFFQKRIEGINKSIYKFSKFLLELNNDFKTIYKYEKEDVSMNEFNKIIPENIRSIVLSFSKYLQNNISGKKIVIDFYDKEYKLDFDSISNVFHNISKSKYLQSEFICNIHYYMNYMSDIIDDSYDYYSHFGLWKPINRLTAKLIPTLIDNKDLIIIIINNICQIQTQSRQLIEYIDDDISKINHLIKMYIYHKIKDTNLNKFGNLIKKPIAVATNINNYIKNNINNTGNTLKNNTLTITDNIKFKTE